VATAPRRDAMRNGGLSIRNITHVCAWSLGSFVRLTLSEGFPNTRTRGPRDTDSSANGRNYWDFAGSSIRLLSGFLRDLVQTLKVLHLAR